MLDKYVDVEQLRNVSRRHFLKESAAGIGAVALGTLLGSCGAKALESSYGATSVMDPMMPKAPHFPGKAKRVIYLHMAGAPSQLEMFDFKPELKKLHNQLCPPSLLEGKRFAFIRGVPRMLGPQAIFSNMVNPGPMYRKTYPILQRWQMKFPF